MRKLLGYGNEYIRQSDWKDLALLKFCLYTLGILSGMFIPKKTRKPVLVISVSVFIATYIPLIFKLFKIMGIMSAKKNIAIEHDEDEDLFGS